MSLNAFVWFLVPCLLRNALIETRLMGEWLFHRVKHLHKLERYIEDVRESSADSSRRDFEYLWGKIQEGAEVRSTLGCLGSLPYFVTDASQSFRFPVQTH